MKNLPTYADAVQAEALTFAREMIARFAHGTSPWSAEPRLSPDAGGAMFRHAMQWALQFTPTRMYIIEAAKAGEPDAIEVLRSLLLECKATRAEMPSDLIAYDMHVTAHGERPQQRPGPKKKSNILRDICIAMTVAALVDRYGRHGITATGTSPRRPLSACAIVVEALRLEAHLSVGVDFDAVKEIWRRYGHHMPTVSGWASS